MLSLSYRKYNIFKGYILKLQRTKEGLQIKVSECVFFFKDIITCGSQKSALFPPISFSCVRIFACLISEAVARKYSS